MRKWKRPDSGQRGDAEFTSLERRGESLHQLAAIQFILLSLDPQIRVYRSFGDKDSRVYTLGVILKRNEAITAIAVADTDYHAGAPFMLERD